MSQDEHGRSENAGVGNFQFGTKAAEVVEFRLGEERCAIDIDGVDGIVERKQITRVPRAPDAVEGVMDLRGETTPVVDPTVFLSIGSTDAAENILVLDRSDDKQKIGILVDEVTEVTSYRESQVDRGDQLGLETTAIEEELIAGVLRKPAGEIDEYGNPEDVSLVLWLDVGRLVERAAEKTTTERNDVEPDANIQA
ncbi:MAG: chemotaxis protein CheW [Halodesulfurarchaeum sp.]